MMAARVPTLPLNRLCRFISVLRGMRYGPNRLPDEPESRRLIRVTQALCSLSRLGSERDATSGSSDRSRPKDG